MNPDGNGESEFGSDASRPNHANADAGMEFGELKERDLSGNAYGSSAPTPMGPAPTGQTPEYQNQPANSGQPVHTGYYRPPVVLKQRVRPVYLPDKPPPPTTIAGMLINAVCLISILGLAAFVCYMQNLPSTEEIKTSPQADLFELTYQARLQLGIMLRTEDDTSAQLDSESRIDFGYFGSVRMRQAGAVMLGETESHDEALRALWKLKSIARQQVYAFTEVEAKTTSILEDIYKGRSVGEADRSHLEKELLWFGKLAWNSKSRPVDELDIRSRQQLLQGTEDMVTRLATAGVTLLVSLLIGMVGCVALMIIYANGTLNVRTLLYSQESSIYLEAFLAWLLTYVLISLSLGIIAPGMNPLLANAIVFLGSLGCGLLWPVLRGKFSFEFRQDIGLTGNPLKELPVAIWCYICALPLIAIGFFVSQALASAFAEPWGDELTSTAPAHPMMEWVLQGDSSVLWGVFLIACVGAPVVEEICFRGFLYRALKDNSHVSGHFASVLVAAVANGFLFAAIHPQGIFFIPALGALGVAFSLAREWRGSLWAPMIMHAIHNFLVTMAVVFFVAS